MKEIKLYHKVWVMLPVLLLLLGLAIAFIVPICPLFVGVYPVTC